jgi:transcription antitermination factor NusG
MSIQEPEWNAIVVRPRSEKSVAQALSLRGVEQYLPVYRGRYRSAGRFKDVDLPLFPQYVFCKMQTCSRAQVLSTPGVFRLLAFGNQLATVDASEMENIRRAVRPGIELQPWPFLAVGDLVEIAEGPLRGLVGRLIRTKGECRLILGISLLQRSMSVTMDRRWVRPCRTPAPALGAGLSSVTAAPWDTAAVLLAA